MQFQVPQEKAGRLIIDLSRLEYYEKLLVKSCTLSDAKV